MKVSWKLNDNQAAVELQPETVMDKMLIDAIGTATSANIKKNGTLQFIMDVPSLPMPKPLMDRSNDEVRDSSHA